MSRQAMETAISDIRSKSVTLAKAQPYLLEVADRIEDNILGILIGMAYTNKCLVVTPSRIIAVGSDGSVEPWRYTDLRGLTFAPGKKKLLGGHDFSFFFVDLPDGTRINFQLNGEYDYIYRVGTLAQDAFRKARLERL